ncbi:MAG TPA: hypothetical protein VMB34_13645 [Acetobacteraceae bacterium]|nr:hypothetical protein [Acetobacteraceae bacterium]
MALPGFMSNLSAPSTTYAGRNFAKQVGDVFIAGSSDTASGVAAEAKAEALEEILQHFFQQGDLEYNGQDIGIRDVPMAIAYVRGKKRTKAKRKAVLATAKFGLQVAATAGGATIGSVIPIAGTALGGAGGFIAGRSLSVGVSAADQLKRKAKGFYKWVVNTRGEHRKQAAVCLMHSASPQFNWADGRNAADMACHVILGEEYGAVMGSHNVERLADRMKSN